MRRRNFHGVAVLLILALVGLFARFQAMSNQGRSRPPLPPSHALVLRDSSDGYRFFVDQLPDGRYGYKAQLVDMPFPVRDQEETGVLSPADWQKLSRFQPAPTVLPGDPSRLSDADLEWGTMERGGSKKTLRYCDWDELEGTVVGKAQARLGFKAKASI